MKAMIETMESKRVVQSCDSIVSISTALNPISSHAVYWAYDFLAPYAVPMLCTQSVEAMASLVVDEYRNQPNDIANRRMLRRKKILENAKSRLEKLNATIPSGIFDECRENQMDEAGLQPLLTSKEVFIDNRFSPDLIGNTSEDLLESSERVSRVTSNSDVIPPSIFCNTHRANCTCDQASGSSLAKLLETRGHVALVSTLTYLVFAICPENYVPCSLFIPLLLIETAELLLCKTNKSTSIFAAQILLILTSNRPGNLAVITKAINIFNKIFKDVGIFMFFFVLHHVFYCTLLQEN